MKKTAVFTLGLSVVLSIAGTAPGYTQTPSMTLSASGLSGMSCAEFNKMTPRHRDFLVAGANRNSPSFGLAVPTITTRRGATISAQHDTGVVAGTPLSAGLIISACQAASPTTSIGDAYRQANSGSGGIRFHR